MSLLVIIRCRFMLPCIKDFWTGEEWYALGTWQGYATCHSNSRGQTSCGTSITYGSQGEWVVFCFYMWLLQYESNGNTCLKIKNTAKVLQFVSCHCDFVKLDGNSLTRNWRFCFHHELYISMNQNHQLNRLETCFNCRNCNFWDYPNYCIESFWYQVIKNTNYMKPLLNSSWWLCGHA